MTALTIQRSLEPGTEEAYSHNWTHGYGSLPEGHYRIVKQIEVNWGTEAHYLAAEFALE